MSFDTTDARKAQMRLWDAVNDRSNDEVFEIDAYTAHWAEQSLAAAIDQVEVWESVGKRIKNGWVLINGHRWWRPGDEPEALTGDQKRVLFPPMTGVVE